MRGRRYLPAATQSGKEAPQVWEREHGTVCDAKCQYLYYYRKKPSPRKNTLINNGEKKKENVLTLRERYEKKHRFDLRREIRETP